MSDLFQDGIRVDYIKAVFDVMQRADWHTYQVLTKRAPRLRQILSKPEYQWVSSSPHVWLGVSVEDKKYGVPRIADLRATPAAVRFLSIEPLLEDVGTLDLSGIHWVIVGGESGPRARPMREEWVVSILKQCRAQRVPFFFKQWGGVQKSRTGRTLQGKIYDEFPTVQPCGIVPTARERRSLEVVYTAGRN